MERREALGLVGSAMSGATLLGSALAEGAGARAQTPPATFPTPSAWSSLLHVWTDAEGVSHAEHLPIARTVKPIPVVQLSIRPETSGFVDWHAPGRSQFAITLEGELEVEVTDGTRLALPHSRLAFLEDTGKGHITRTKSVVNLFIQTPARVRHPRMGCRPSLSAQARDGP